MSWTPRPRADVDLRHLPLDALQGYLLSRLDGHMDVPTVATLVGLPEAQVKGMLEQLVHLGAVEEPGGSPSRPAPPAVHEPEGPASSEVPQAAEPQPVTEPTRVEEGEEGPLPSSQLASYRQLYETHLHARPLDQRAAQAQVAVDPDLSAWCFDPTVDVIRALFENPRLGPVQARLIATHHRTTAGLEALCARPGFTNDAGVRRALLQNPVLPPGIFRRLWSPRRLLDQFLVSTSHEVTDQTRTAARDLLRATFNQRPGEERAELILATEGRCLASLVGCTLDSHATAILCRRTYTSTLLIQNLARWSAAPPPLIAHLRRQDLVKRNPSLRQMLERHPNAS